MTVAANGRFSEPMLSRYCRGRVLLDLALDDPEPFIASLLRHLETNEYDALLPLSDHTTIPLSLHRDRVQQVVPIAVPPAAAIQLAADKLGTLKLAGDLGIQGPATWAPESRAELDEIAETLPYPAVFKFRGGAGSDGLRTVRDARELRAAYDALPTRTDDLLFDYRPLIQEFIPGELVDLCVLFRHGEPRAALTQRRVHMYPRGGGSGTVNETTDAPEVRELGLKLLEALDWHGPAQVEFRMDPRDGVPKLMEINGRFWGSTDLAVQAGVDVPELTARLARDGDVESVFDYEVGLRYRWPLPFGVLALLQWPEKGQAINTFFGPGRGVLSDLTLRDPLPMVGSMWWTAKEVWRGH